MQFDAIIFGLVLRAGYLIPAAVLFLMIYYRVGRFGLGCSLVALMLVWQASVIQMMISDTDSLTSIPSYIRATLSAWGFLFPLLPIYFLLPKPDRFGGKSRA
ncbi:hypothetical protein [Roseovarius rhodophyticola]|uniref:Uncharacterized protein n=1 Tax=Roseovarius rhodophyticola TaxID=3080827 RepID=A0ABZ2TDD9_9RHOB|nr:hypothetical protein [Roseovarius sp. W115]MDV2931446.1 hypothetical protein [Roseovarius sp. W115]